MSRQTQQHATPRPHQATRTTRASLKKSGGGTLIGLFIGVVIGLLCAFGVAWYMQNAPTPFLDKGFRTEDPARPAQTEPPAPLPGKPGDKPLGSSADKPRFDFYKILPGGEVTTPPPAGHVSEVDPAQTAESPPAPPVDTFYLQAGAFQKSADADNLKAKLALMGLETSVQEADVAGKGVMYRVRVGPFAAPEEMNRVRNQLSLNGIQAALIKIKEKPAE